MKNFNELFNSTYTIEEDCKTVNKNCHFYHVTSHSFNDENIYNFSTATYRHNMLYELCKKNNCILLLDVIKPTHSHELIMCQKFQDLSAVMKTLNSHVGHFIRTQKEKKYAIKGMHIFNDSPSYTAVTNHVHLLYLVKYFWHNCQELTEKGKPMPYSCFDQIKAGFSKSYKLELLEDLFMMPYTETIKLCEEKTDEEFLKYCREKYINISPQEENDLFMINEKF